LQLPKQENTNRGLLEPLPPPWCGFPHIVVARIGERKNTKSDHRNDAGLRVLAIGCHQLPNLQHNPHIAAYTTEPTGRKYLANLCTVALTHIIINPFIPHNPPPSCSPYQAIVNPSNTLPPNTPDPMPLASWT
jgi:hypothetical protein